MLRSIGCTRVGVRRSLVKSGQYTCKSQTCIAFIGNREVFPLALISVDTPFYKGGFQCCVVDKPLCDML